MKLGQNSAWKNILRFHIGSRGGLPEDLLMIQEECQNLGHDLYQSDFTSKTSKLNVSRFRTLIAGFSVVQDIIEE